jgi:sulfatase maturation enzyme AslB (radical SAM superfamily)
MYGPLPHKKIIRPYKDEETFWQKVEPYMDTLEEIYFAGGEPLIMEEHYRILKKLDERKMYHVRLKYNTNFSQMVFKGLDVMEIWSRFESVKIGASLDGSGKQGEYLRKGQSWEQVLENRKRMFDVCPDVFIFLATCLNAYNCFHVPDFHHEWIQKGWVDAVGGSLVNPLFVPEELSIKILPPRMKERLTKRYEQEQKWFDDHTNNTEKRYDKLIHFLHEADHTHLIPKFWERTNMVDKLRQEDCLTLFPELSDLKSPQLV